MSNFSIYQEKGENYLLPKGIFFAKIVVAKQALLLWGIFMFNELILNKNFTF